MGALIAFLLSPIGRLVAVALICSVTGGIAGWRGEKAFSDARWSRAVAQQLSHNIKVLEARLTAEHAAGENDQKRAAAAADAHKQQKDRADALEQEFSSLPDADVCTDDAGTERVRGLWQSARPGANSRPSAGAGRPRSLLQRKGGSAPAR